MGHGFNIQKHDGVVSGGGWPTMGLHIEINGRIREEELSNGGDPRRKRRE